MKNLITKNNKNRILLVLFILFAFFTTLFFTSFKSAKATTNVDAGLFLPNTSMEYFDLNSGAPQDAFYFDNKVAIISNANTLVVYNGKYISRTWTKLLKQVKLFTENKLLVSLDAKLNIIDITSPTLSTQQLEYEDEETGFDVVTGEKFDLNDKYLISAIGTSAHIYERNETGITNKVDSEFLKHHLIDGKPICINEENEIFYVTTKNDEETLCKRGIVYDATVGTGVLTLETVVTTASPDNMVANGKYVYYTQGQKVYRVSVNGGESTELALLVDNDFDLGSLQSPSGICFKDNNLLITDSSLRAIQEFEVTANNTLNFTGFAIAKNKTAFNRIGQTATEIEKYGKTIAVKDKDKITIFNGEEHKNYFVNDFKCNIDMFALGEKSMLFYDNTEKSLTYFDIATGNTLSWNNNNLGRVTDVCYSNGKYYVVSYDLENVVRVFTTLETLTGFGFNPIIINDNIRFGTTNPQIVVDTDGSIYLTSAQHEGSIIKYSLADNYQTFTTIATNVDVAKIKKLNVDLCENVFALMPNNFILKINENGVEQLNVNLLLESIYGVASAEINSFALDYEEEKVYFILNGEETIFTTTKLTNVALNSLQFNSNPFEEKSSTDIENLKIYQVKPNSTLYLIDINGLRFDYKGLFTNTENQFIKLDSITYSNVNFVALAVQSEYGTAVSVLAKEKDLTEVNAISQSNLERSYVSTNVCAYYLPLITEGDVFTLKLNGEKIRILQNTEFHPVNTETFNVVTFLGKEFYFAKVNYNGTLINCYIPVSFTVEKLSQIEYNPTFTFRYVYETAVYQDESLTEEVLTLSSGTEIRLIETKNGVCKIMYKLADNNWEFGYILESGLQPIKNDFLRNVLIAGCILICIFATTLFLALRKKKTN
ncbi:MAG: hypothetical protein IKW33_01645 [Clostridia bacterium]|nr:hypothetical protein [Clostridia bacterium]